MKIKTHELPLTLDAIRQEVIQKEGKKMVMKYEQKYMNLAMFLITIPFGMLILAITLNGGNRVANIISIPVFSLMIMGCLSAVFVIRGKAEKEYYSQHFPSNFGLSEEDIHKRVKVYVQNTLDELLDELQELDDHILKAESNQNATIAAYDPILELYFDFKATLQP